MKELAKNDEKTKKSTGHIAASSPYTNLPKKFEHRLLSPMNHLLVTTKYHPDQITRKQQRRKKRDIFDFR